MAFKISHGSILAVFFQASSAEVMAGRRWYGDALEACKTIAATYGLSVDTVAGVVAALSPNNRWERNLVDAENICKLYTLGGYDDAAQCKVSTFHANKRKALQILKGTEPLEALGGLKVKAFYQCIINLPAVCVDGHAYAIWKGERIPTTKTPKISAKLYDAIAADYQHAADTINGIIGTEFCAAQVQAITWCAWRRIIKESTGESK
jgi:hypothetical protein